MTTPLIPTDLRLRETMMNRRSLLLAAASVAAGCSAPRAGSRQPVMPDLTYPATRRVDVTEERFGRTVADPYRWLEADARATPEVAQWITNQNAVTEAYLGGLPGRDVFRRRLQARYQHDRVTSPRKGGYRYFYTRRSGLENQARLCVREGLTGQDSVLIDPNAWSDDNADALAEWAVSRDGRRLAYAVQTGGSDWRTIRVLDVDGRRPLADEVKWARITQIAWHGDGSGFFYSRYPEPRDGRPAALANHAIYFHRLGTPQAQDRLVFATPAHPERMNALNVTEDGRYATIISTANVATNTLHVIDLQTPDWAPRVLVDDTDNAWAVNANDGARLFVYTNLEAPRGRLVVFDLATPGRAFETLVPQSGDNLYEVRRTGDQLLATYLVDAKAEVRRFDLAGGSAGVVPLPGVGAVEHFQGAPDDGEVFFEFASFNTPKTVYRYDAATGAAAVWAGSNARVADDQLTVEQRFYASRDGARVPMFIVRRRDSSGPAPTLLYAYGGYGISLTPAYSALLAAWADQGGIVAVANIRGGGEYGAAWHEAARGLKRQTAFDDFIAAAEDLKSTGLTPPAGLAVYGDSNGGLLVGAAVNQRPDLFDAALPQVGVMDMIRFPLFEGGAGWIGEFGNPATQADFLNLLSYSPYHNVKAGRPYPAILATTTDADTRVVPAHTFKYIATLQALDLGPKPRLVRVETRAGHGAGTPTDKVIAQTADMWAFAAEWTGLDVSGGSAG